MKDLFFTISPEADGSGRGVVCTDPLNITQSTVWSHTVTSADIRSGKTNITRVVQIAFGALRKGATPAQASEEAGVA
jgi:hypothetical protein